MAELLSNEGYDSRRTPSDASLRGYSGLGEVKRRGERRSGSRQGDFEDIIEVQPEEPEESKRSRTSGLGLHQESSRLNHRAAGSHYDSGYSESGPAPRVRQEFAAAVYAHNGDADGRNQLPGGALDLLG